VTHPVIGWEKEIPVPDHVFNDFLSARGGRLYYGELDLAQILAGGHRDQGLGRTLPSPLELVYLPKIRQKVADMRRLFAEVSAEIGYQGQFHYAYASKANAAEEVIRTALDAETHYEMSSSVDIEIARLMQDAGHLSSEQMVIANGFKGAGTDYSEGLICLKSLHDRLIPVVEDLAELPPFANSGLQFDVGLRQKSYGHHTSAAQMDAANSRFGMTQDDIWRAADAIAAAPNLHLRLYHAMIGSQITDERAFAAGLEPAIEIYARLRQRHPELCIFDFGGGMPAPMTLNFDFDYRAFVRRLLTALQARCAEHGVPVPDVMGEFGRYTTTEHGVHMFRVATVKDNGARLPWYIIDGSIMTSFPDSWALSEHFIVLPLNHLDKPFQRVQLGGMTCDSDDVYPPKGSQAPLYLPVETRDLYVGFFCIGAYQEMLGGVRGSKHCVLPEAVELLVESDDNDQFEFTILPGQTANDVLINLGYPVPSDWATWRA